MTNRTSFHLLLNEDDERLPGDEYYHIGRRTWIPYDPLWPPDPEPKLVRRRVRLPTFEDFWARESLGKCDNFWNIAKFIAQSAWRNATQSIL